MLTANPHIYFIGIGGIGMSALAEMLYRQGYTVSGSDQTPNDQTRHLQSLGISVFYGHDARHVEGDLVVYTPAIAHDNPELAEARRRGRLCIKRAEMLGELIRGKKCIAIAGTHGKTTTSAMTGMMMVRAGFDPVLFVGGVIRDIESNVRTGRGEWVVVEADEYDRSFLHLFPTIGVINNIEPDHLDCYSDLNDLKNHFIRFANQTSVFGCVLINADQEGAQSIIPHINRTVWTYGRSPEADLRASDVRLINGCPQFSVYLHTERLGELQLPVPGEHQIWNALGCIGAGLAAGLPFGVIREALTEFRGTHRRFEILGVVQGVTWVDDYAHHPTEIRATLQAARHYFPGKRLIAVFQPHLYSRTHDLMEDFANAFSDADMVWLTDIYAAREMPPQGKDLNRTFRERMEKAHACIRYTADIRTLPNELIQQTRAGDVVLTLGAGDITQVGRHVIHRKETHDGIE